MKFLPFVTVHSTRKWRWIRRNEPLKMIMRWSVFWKTWTQRSPFSSTMCPDFSRVSAVYIIVCGLWSAFCMLNVCGQQNRQIPSNNHCSLFVLQPFKATASIGIRSSHRSVITSKSCCGETSHARLNFTSSAKIACIDNIARSDCRPISAGPTTV